DRQRPAETPGIASCCFRGNREVADILGIRRRLFGSEWKGKNIRRSAFISISAVQSSHGRIADELYGNRLRREVQFMPDDFMEVLQGLQSYPNATLSVNNHGCPEWVSGMVVE